jgi:hypothetical protein
MRISLIIPFFGNLPAFFPLFVQSASRNPRVNFIVISNETIGFPLPPNFIHVPFTPSDVEKRVREKVCPDFRLSYGYKLCDVKPFYGVVFDDLLKTSDFWGYCDIDLVFGDVSPLLDSGALDETDFYCADAGPVVATFCLFRNQERVNRLAFRIPDFEKRLTSGNYESTDEKALEKLIRDGVDIRHTKAANLRHSQLSISAAGRMVGRTQGVVGDPNEFYWSDGRTFVKAPGSDPQEVLYLHFIGLKRSYHWTEYNRSVQYKEFAFSAAGFLPWRTPPTVLAALKHHARITALRVVGWSRAQVARHFSTEFRHKLKSRF